MLSPCNLLVGAFSEILAAFTSDLLRFGLERGAGSRTPLSVGASSVKGPVWWSGDGNCCSVQAWQPPASPTEVHIMADDGFDLSPGAEPLPRREVCTSALGGSDTELRVGTWLWNFLLERRWTTDTIPSWQPFEGRCRLSRRRQRAAGKAQRSLAAAVVHTCHAGLSSLRP